MASFFSAKGPVTAGWGARRILEFFLLTWFTKGHTLFLFRGGMRAMIRGD
jgi:hypothetical protein